MKKRKAIIVDLDGTYFDISHRLHYVNGPEKDYGMFFSSNEMRKDKVNYWCVFLVEKLGQSVEVIFLTGRPERTRGVTMCNMEQTPKYLMMRPEEDYSLDFELKEKTYLEVIEPNFEVVLAIDDSPAVVEMFRKHGIPCLDCGRAENLSGA